MLAVFKKLSPQESLETCYEQLEAIEASINSTESTPVSQFICLFFQNNNALGFLKRGETVVEYAVKSVPGYESMAWSKLHI